MTFREAPHREPCVACPDAATGRCARCGDPLCAAHVFGADALCHGCETLRLEHGPQDDRTGRAHMTLIALPMVAAFGAAIALASPVLGLAGAASAVIGLPSAVWLERRRRRRFVEERRRLAAARAPERPADRSPGDGK
jgi:hypothetical protein